MIVGDGECGKSSLLIVHSREQFPLHYLPTFFDSYVSETNVDGRGLELSLWDTAGQEDYQRLR